MRRTRGSFALLAALALALGACGSAPDTGSVSPPGPASPTSAPASSAVASAPPAAMPSTSPWSPHPVAGGVDTDQICTATAALSARMVLSDVAPNELLAMVLDRPSTVFPGVAWATEPGDFGYQDNAVLGDSDRLGKGACDAFTRTGRLTGYVRVWEDESTRSSVTSEVHAFLSEQGAADFLPWLTSGVAQGNDLYFARQGSVVTNVARVTLTDVGSDGAATELVLTTDTSRMVWVGFRVGHVVGSVGVAGSSPTVDRISPSAMARHAVAQVRAAHATGTPYDSVLLLSVPVPKSQLGAEFAQYRWDVCCSGGVDSWQVAESLTDPMGDARRAAEGWLVGVRARYAAPVGDGGTTIDAVWSGMNVYRTPAGAERSRTRTVALALTGTSAAGPATRFAVTGLPGAVGLVTVLHDGDTTYQVTRVVLPVHGSVVLSAGVTGTVGVSHVQDAARVALLLHQRWHTTMTS